MKIKRKRINNLKQIIASTKFCKVVKIDNYLPSDDVILVSKSNLQRNSVKYFENMLSMLNIA